MFGGCRSRACLRQPICVTLIVSFAVDAGTRPARDRRIATETMTKRRLRVYADTSVFGGCLDEEFSEDSKAFFEQIRAGRFTLVVSSVTLRELLDAPEDVRRILAGLLAENVENLSDPPETVELRDAYIEAGVLGPGSLEDAEHVAAASVGDVDMLVSWNFKHIVHFEKINGYHGVNLIRGYRPVSIYSPKEVIEA